MKADVQRNCKKQHDEGNKGKNKQTGNIKLSTQRHRNKISKATGHSADQREIKNKGSKLDRSRYVSRLISLPVAAMFRI